MQRIFATIFLVLSVVVAVDRHKFRKCENTGFCKRYRHTQPDATSVVPGSLQVGADGIQARLSPSGTDAHDLELAVTFFEPGLVRVRITEGAQYKPRWESPDVVIDENLKPLPFAVLAQTQAELKVNFPSQDGVVATVQLSPFVVNLERNGLVTASLNSKGFFHFEQRQLHEHRAVASDDHHTDADGNKKEIVDWGEDGKPIYADGTVGEVGQGNDEDASPDGEGKDNDVHGPETFGGHTDHRPHGATSVGMDVLFPNSKHLFGIPEHATTHSLMDTIGAGAHYDEPYRLYNLDVFEYELDEPMALYGAIPVLFSHSKTAGTVGVFWNNPSETFVDVSTLEAKHRHSRWLSESGVHDVFILMGPTPRDVTKQYTTVTGTTPIPPMFSLGYHQCRWNYRDEKDVADVNANFEEDDFTYDVIWLDIEHTDGKRYFTWDPLKFPTPADMQSNLAAFGRKLVTIVDPHIKRDNNYAIHSEATKLGYYIKDPSNEKDFDGWCWPGSSSYLDFTSSAVRDWWADLFAYEKYKGSSNHMFTWNDMNEPSVFNGPEVSMTKEALSLQGVEHREWHNLYGFYHQWATNEGLIRRNPGHNERGFVLTRAFFAGSQRFGAMWTGDNAAEWSHLEISVPMLLTIGMSGVVFCGADVGGFFGNPEEELLIRWYQAGSFQPFFRAHAHLDTKRREPYLFEERTMKIIRQAVRTRYTYLPLWYTLYQEAFTNGTPVMRPLWYEYPDDESVFAVQDAWLVGSDLLVRPVLKKGERAVQVYFPGGPSVTWYDVVRLTAHVGGQTESVEAPLHVVPVYQRSGSIVPRKMRVRRSSQQMRHDPYTLNIALDANGAAVGRLYIDDEHSFDYQRDQFAEIHFSVKDNVLRSTVNLPSKDFVPAHKIERIVVMGLANQPKGPVQLNQGVCDSPAFEGLSSVEFGYSYHASRKVITLKTIALDVATPFEIDLRGSQQA